MQWERLEARFMGVSLMARLVSPRNSCTCVAHGQLSQQADAAAHARPLTNTGNAF